MADADGATREEQRLSPGLTPSTSQSAPLSNGPSSRHQSVTGLTPELEKADTARPSPRTLSPAQGALYAIRSRNPVPPFSHHLSKAKTGPECIVDFDGSDDPYRPLNWAFEKKVITTLLYAFTTMGATWASAVYAPGIDLIATEFDVTVEVSTLGVSLLLFGFGIGPLLWAPLSEVYGRRPAVLAPYFVSAIFAFGTATAKDIQTVLITRFFAGLFGSAPITNTGGMLGDIWPPESRGVAMVCYSMAVVGGPVLGPIVGGAICESHLGWRWTEYLTGIFMLFILTLDVLILDESCPPMLLVYKARRLRLETGNWALHARHEEWDITIRQLARKYLVRPFQMLFTPICFLVAVYASFVYGILYASLASFPIEFEDERSWNQVVGALPFLALFIGIMLAAVANILNQKYYFKRFRQNNNRAVPEARLPPMMFGSVVFASGLFIFAWTSDRSIHWIGPVLGAVCVGVGFFTIFQAALNYLIDTFQKFAASAIAANTFLRSMFAGAFPLFLPAMPHKLGIDWVVSIFGFVAVALMPIPYMFFIFGSRIRARGAWSRESV